MSSDLVIRSMIRSEVDDLVEWAAREGWNPGRHDAGIFWRTDPAADLAADLAAALDGELVRGHRLESGRDRPRLRHHPDH